MKEKCRLTKPSGRRIPDGFLPNGPVVDESIIPLLASKFKHGVNALIFAALVFRDIDSRFPRQVPRRSVCYFFL